MTEPTRVTIAWVHENEVGAAFVESLLRLVSYDKNVGGGHLLHESGFNQSGAIIPVWGRGGDMAFFRNTAAAAFLETDSDWLLWVDSDMGFPADALDRMLRTAHPVQRPIVGGLCFIEQNYSNDFTGGLVTHLAPTIYDWIFMPNGEGYKLLPRVNYERGAVVECAATGTGFLLTHRSVFEKISDWCVETGAPPNIWYQRIPGPTGQPSGEDISFCMRAGQLGIPILVDTGLKITHQKTIWYREADYDIKPVVFPETGLPLLGREEWPQLLVNRHAAADARRSGSALGNRQWPAASEKTLILVPVMKRPQNALTFMATLRESLADERMATVMAMTDRYDIETAQAWYAQGAGVDSYTYADRVEGGTFAQKINRGFSEYAPEYPWVFIVGDDVSFQPGWLDAAQQRAHASGAKVIGTNDLGSEAVREGRHATHMLISTDYIEEVGASWDGPGVVCHEGYGHWFVDNEIVDAAKERGVWTPCLDAVVEHRHPIFNKGHNDDIYRLGQSSAKVDAELFRARSAARIWSSRDTTTTPGE